LLQAISCLKRATYLAPFEWKILYNLGLVHLAMTQYASAFHFLRAAQRLQPQDPYILMLLGAALGYLNDTENSLKAYQQSIYHSTSSDDPVLYLNYSIALFNNADIEGAVKHYRMFQMKLRALPSDSVTDSEITNISTKLAAVLQVGDIKHKKKMKQEHKEGMDVAVANENTEYEMGAFTDIVEEQK
jgi:Bardet-Biedl syndrome 4 protein